MKKIEVVTVLNLSAFVSKIGICEVNHVAEEYNYSENPLRTAWKCLKCGHEMVFFENGFTCWACGNWVSGVLMMGS